MDDSVESLYRDAQAVLFYLQPYYRFLQQSGPQIRDTHEQLLPYVTSHLDECTHLQNLPEDFSAASIRAREKVQVLTKVGWRLMREIIYDDAVFPELQQSFDQELGDTRFELSRTLLDGTLRLILQIQLRRDFLSPVFPESDLQLLHRWLSKGVHEDDDSRAEVKAAAAAVRSWLPKVSKKARLQDVRVDFRYELGGFDIRSLSSAASRPAARSGDRQPFYRTGVLDSADPVPACDGITLVLENFIAECECFGGCVKMPEFWE